MKKIIISLFSVLTLTACGDWFDITPDSTVVPQDKFFENENAFLNALTDIYTQLRSESLYGETLSVGHLEFMGQNFAPKDEYVAAANLNYTDAEFAATISDTYREMYRAIASCNNAIEHIESTSVVFNNRGQKEIITGELYALRGTLHFELLRLFHPNANVNPSFKGIPYMTEFGTEVSEPLSTTQLISKITADLKHAEKLLKDHDPILSGASSGTILPGQIDSKLRTFAMNYYAVKAVLSRVYLYTENYEEAFNCASATFDHLELDKRRQVYYFFGPGEYLDDYSFSREHIFGIASPPTGLTAKATQIYTQSQVSKHYAATFPVVKDTRYRDWFDNSTAESVKMTYKFGESSVMNGYTSVEGSESVLPCRIPFVKLGEMCLIAAEALVRKSDANLSDAAQWIIRLQDKRDVSIVKTMKEDNTLTVDALLTEIENEYRREFYGEGQLFYYYKRMNKTSMPKHDGSSMAMTSEEYTLPIPAATKVAK